jgi:hypothetical protein
MIGKLVIVALVSAILLPVIVMVLMWAGIAPN